MCANAVLIFSHCMRYCCRRLCFETKSNNNELIRRVCILTNLFEAKYRTVEFGFVGIVVCACDGRFNTEKKKQFSHCAFTEN